MGEGPPLGADGTRSQKRVPMSAIAVLMISEAGSGEIVSALALLSASTFGDRSLWNG